MSEEKRPGYYNRNKDTKLLCYYCSNNQICKFRKDVEKFGFFKDKPDCLKITYDCTEYRDS